MVNHPIRYDGQSAEMYMPPQPLEAQSAEILIELGWDEVSINKLVEDNIVLLAD